MNIWTIEDKTTTPSQNIGHQPRSDMAQHPNRNETSTVPSQKPENSHNHFLASNI